MTALIQRRPGKGAVRQPARLLLKPRDVADLAGVHPNTVLLWANEGLLPCIRLQSGHRRYEVEHVAAFLRSEPFGDGPWAVQVYGSRIFRAAASFDAASQWVSTHNVILPGTANVTLWPGTAQAHALVLERHVRKAIR